MNNLDLNRSQPRDTKIRLYGRDAFEGMRKAGQLAARALDMLVPQVKPGVTTEQLDELVAAYYGRPLRNKIARARLWGLMSKYGWTLWGSIQDGISDIDFDFWGWAMEKYDRAVAEFDDPAFGRLLEQAAADG